ncbi:MAG: LLM class flavin-dependent oxidoreductase [Solirubrobacteraceae bacterium]
MAVKFGILAPAYPPASAALEAVRRAERLGWDFVDYPDQLVSTNPYGQLAHNPVPAGDPSLPSGFFSDQWMGSLEMCAAAAVLTERIPLIVGVIDPLRRAPSVMAQELLTLSHLSSGRTTFAIGTGEAKQFRPYGISREKAITRSLEAIAVWRALWSFDGTPITRPSEFYPLDNAVFPLRPFEGQPPSLLAVGAGPKIFDLAGRVCDGWLTYLPSGLADNYSLIAEMVGMIKQIAADSGRDPEALRFNAMVNVCLGETDERAWELVRHPVSAWISIAAAGINSGETWKRLGHTNPLSEDFVWSRDMDALVVPAADVPSMAEQVPDEIADSVYVWGAPERVAARLQKIIDAGINELCLMNVGAGADPEYASTWNDLASDVLVRLGHAPLTVDADLAAVHASTSRCSHF